VSINHTAIISITLYNNNNTTLLALTISSAVAQFLQGQAASVTALSHLRDIFTSLGQFLVVEYVWDFDEENLLSQFLLLQIPVNQRSRDLITRFRMKTRECDVRQSCM
jgi:hypothetical protein